MKYLITLCLSGLILTCTAQTTHLFKDINPGPVTSSSNFRGHYLIKVNDRIVFGATENGSSQEGLFSTNGLPGGTIQLLPSGSGYFERTEMIEYNGKVFFWVANRLWETDGTTAGTVEVDTIPSNLDAPQDFIIYNSKIFFYSAVTGNLGVFDPAMGTVSSISDSITDITQIVATGSGLFVDGRSQFYGRELYHLNETTNALELMADLQPGTMGSDPKHMRAAGNNLFFAGKHTNYHRPFFSDGTPAGTQVINPNWRVYGSGSAKDIALNESVSHQGKTYFNLMDGNNYHICETDGTIPGTVNITPNGEIADVMVGSDNFLYYQTGAGHWKKYPLGGGSITMVDTLWAADAQYFNVFGKIGYNTIGDSLFVIGLRGSVGEEPFVYNGNPGDSLRLMADIYPGSTGSGLNRSNFVKLGDAVFFSVQDDVHGIELFCMGCTPDTASTSGVVTYRTDNFRVYPNPSSGIFNFTFDEGTDKLEIYSLTGSLVHSVRISGLTRQLDFSSFSPGLYFYSVSGARPRTGKIILE